jgi:hypothetical protein
MASSRAKLVAATGVTTALAALAIFGSSGVHRAGQVNAAAQFLPEDHLVLKSARNVDVKAGTVVVPIHRGVANGKTVWYIITDASDYGIAHDLNVLYAPKLANMAINCAECVQTATLGKPTGKFNNDAILHFEGRSGLRTDPRLRSIGHRLPAAQSRARRGRRRALQPVRADRRIERDLQHADRGDRRRTVRRDPSQQHPRPRPRDRYETGRRRPRSDDVARARIRLGQPIVYLSTEASDPGAAAVERATYVPLLGHVSFANGDDNLGSARERIFVFVNGPTAADDGQGLMSSAYTATSEPMPRRVTSRRSVRP